MTGVLAGFELRNLGSELLAGITLVTIAIPLNIGYAQIAGLPPTAGLYALIVPTVVYALTVSSRQVVVSPDAAAAALVASSLGGLAAAGSDAYLTMALAQAIICGAVLLLMAVCRLGFLANFLSEPILVGFVGGLALDILVSQAAKMLGIHLESGEEFVGKLIGLIGGLVEANPWSALISALSLGVIVLGRRLSPLVPWALIVLVGATAAVAVAGAEEAGVAVLGEVPAGLPVLTLPTLGLHEWLLLIPSALALTAVISVEGLLVSRSYAERRGYPVDADRDLAAYGLANVAAGLSGSFSVGSSTSRTAAMDQAGSRTQLPSLLLAAVTLILLLFGTGLLESIPSPAIGAIVAVAVAPLLGLRKLRRLWRLDRFEFAVAAVCFLVTVLVGSIPGIIVAFVLALINLARRAAHPAIDVLAVPGEAGAAPVSPDADSERLIAGSGTVSAPGVLVIRLAAPLFFANAEEFMRTIRRSVDAAAESGEPVRHLVLDLEAVTDVDVTAADGFARLREWLDARQIEIGFSRVRTGALPRLRRFGVIAEPDRVYASNREALRHTRER
ncbi:SulP family inorganic anion transporter [Leucobacter weissii]|uniref:SulP family inorganic anion transporter n=1 Tax=Leucobacter weissii TaxID=1983706 RepID=A0A939MKA3_9MICO|nr:SulP family inorganic anion transporter [Leucobacter weissii]MBO1902538.1 SulP family inorganic anion transporter [Leucobacter weissii]